MARRQSPLAGVVLEILKRHGITYSQKYTDWNRGFTRVKFYASTPHGKLDGCIKELSVTKGVTSATIIMGSAPWVKSIAVYFKR